MSPERHLYSHPPYARTQAEEVGMDTCVSLTHTRTHKKNLIQTCRNKRERKREGRRERGRKIGREKEREINERRKKRITERKNSI